MDKNHVHMNSTKWASLSDFVQYLGKKGICVVEETERGWYVTYIERDPALLARQEALKKKAEADQREEQLAAERREVLRMEAAKALDRAGGVMERVASEIGSREESGDKKMIEMKLSSTMSTASQPKKKRKGNTGAKLSLVEEDGDDESDHVDIKEKKFDEKSTVQDHDRYSNQRVMKAGNTSPTNSTRQQEPPTKASPNDTEKRDHKYNKKQKADDSIDDEKKKDYWLYRDIIVRIINKKLSSGQYYKRKAIVEKVIDKYEARVEVLESSRKANDGGDILRLDQDDLETVIPKKVGEKVRILAGKHRGKKAKVLRLTKEDYRAELRLTDDDRVVMLDYEDFSMLA